MMDTQDYTIGQKIGDSASAIVLFVHRPHVSDDVVLKVLKEMKDIRYNLSTLEKRQKCQIRALAWNPGFTSDVYFGLAPIRETLEELKRKMSALDKIGVGSVLDSLEQLERLPQENEYALLMRRLPEHFRFDKLLVADRNYRKGEPIPSYLLLLLKRISVIHEENKDFPTLGIDEDELEAREWGSVEQLREKLRENLEWLESEMTSNLARIQGLSNICTQLKENLPRAFSEEKYLKLFEKRLEKKRIKHCHGDLKANNIWIEIDGLQCNDQPETCVKLLDCIDFKLSFCMIDTLSDIALLIADIQAYTKNPALADAVIDAYLSISGEDVEEARALLAYYLVEKAMIGMVNSYIDDENDVLGRSYTDVVYQRLDELVSRINTS